MPRIVGIREKSDQVFYSGWVADTRPDGVGISHEAHFRNPMRLFMTDIGNPLRTNMYTSGGFPGDQSVLIHKMGYHVSFSRNEDFRQAFDNPGICFDLKVNNTSAHHIDTEAKMPDPELCYYGIRRLPTLEKPIVVMPRQSFFIELQTSNWFADVMRAIEAGRIQAYAEIKSLIDTTLSREVQ